MAPEGPGTPASDVYSLGKVLYEMFTGQEAELFPEMPTVLMEAPLHDLADDLNRIVGKACEHDPQRRYKTATEMLNALHAIR
jgi:serine/threonine protein kinase